MMRTMSGPNRQSNEPNIAKGDRQGSPAAKGEVIGTDASIAESEWQPSILPREIGGREGPEPTRFGDWEKAGRCIDF